MSRSLRRLVRRLIPRGDVLEQTVKSGVWVGLINVTNRVLQLAMVVVLARLLDPADFGLMGIALLSLSALRAFSRLGLDEALVQRVEADVDALLNTAWTLQIVRGILVAGIAVAAAPVVAEFFDEPRVVPLITTIAVAPLFHGFRNPGIVYLEKDLEFHRRFVYTVSSTVVRVVVSLGYALIHPTVWALAIGYVAESVVKAGLSYWIHGYRPWPEFDFTVARELLDYGKWVMGTGMVGFLYGQGDDAFVGWFLGSSALGIYQLTYRLSNAPATEISHVVTRVIFPSYSKVQDDVATLRRGFLDVLQATTFVSIPIAVGIIVVTPTFVPVVLGDDWLAMIAPMQVLTVYGLLRSCRSPTTPLFKAVGRPDIVTKLKTGKLLVIAAAIYPASARYGLVGTTVVITATSFVASPIAWYLATEIVDARLRDLLRPLAYPAVGSAAMGAVVLAVRSASGLSPVFELPVLVVTGVVVYAAAMVAIETRFEYGMEELVRNVGEAL